MSAESLGRRLVRALIQEPSARSSLFAGHSRTLRQIERGADVYEVIAQTPALRRLVERRFGELTVEEILAADLRWQVDARQAEAYLELLMDGALLGTHEALVAAKRGGPLGRILESDHLIEQRLHRMIRDGPAGHTVRSPEYALPSGDAQRALERDWGAEHLAETRLMQDALAILVPANEVVHYRMTRKLRELTRGASHPGLPDLASLPSVAPWYYIHQGVGSKTARMRELLPWRLEGAYSYQEMLDATRWVLCHEFNLSPVLEQAIREDMVESIVYAIRHDDEAAEILLPSLPGPRIRSPDSDRLEGAVRDALHLTPLDASRFDRARWNYLPPIVGPVEQAAEAELELRRLLEGEAPHPSEGGLRPREG
ncbi:hypothetical protein HPP05_11020 [Corallococcus exiguus]|uniref:hypothetical protein n=1 Tax=Corallococcus exiguus TaxID=83462 RepID=UPI001494740B|nr:hypothetical protein [Corallococcus exiguus]NPC70276.1 hypothetical protein [Corallococcus exiguus]